MRWSACVVVSAIVGSGCGSSPENVGARYVSPIPYANWTCEQLAEERVRLSAEVTRVDGLQRDFAGKQTAAFVFNVISPVPLPLDMIGPQDPSSELSRLKGEYGVVEQTAKQKSCLAAPAPPLAPSAASPPH